MTVSSNKCAERMPKIVECCDILVAILCAALFILTVVVMQSAGFERVDNMIAVDTSFETGEEAKISPRSFLPWLLVMAIAGIVAAVFGCAGVAPRDNPGCLSTHLLMMLSLAVVFLVISVSFSQFEDTMEPVIDRQVNEFCGPATYPTYADRLNCSSQPLHVDSPCGTDCDIRINLIRGMGRCSFLNGEGGVGGLCSDYNYQALGAGSCHVASLVPPSWTATKPTSAECQTACSGTTSCSGFAYSGTSCSLVSIDQPADASVVWTQAANTTPAVQPITAIASVADAASACYVKGTPQIVFDAFNYAFGLATLCYLTSSMMFAAAVVGGVYTFTVATGSNAGSKKGLDKILYKMCCPCLWPSRGKQLTQDCEGGAE